MPELSKRYDVFEHTADVGIQVYGETLKDLFAHGGFALFDFMLDLSSVGQHVSEDITLECFDREELFVRWLSELLFLFEAKGLVLKYFDVHFVRGGRLRATVGGEKFVPGHHQIFNQVKAITYHQVQVRKEKDIWIARVILDL